MKSTFVREGTEERPRYYVVTEYAMQDKPTMITYRYKAIRSEGPVHALTPPCEVEYLIAHRCHVASVHGAKVYIYTDDVAETIESTIPPPKTSLPIRYRDGRWQKQSKRGVWS